MNYHIAKGATEDLVHSDVVKPILLHNMTFLTCSAVQKNPQSPLEFLVTLFKQLFFFFFTCIQLLFLY